MVRVITQETYDEVVKENIDEFSMTPEEAIDDAVKQFEAQGIDLSNVVKDMIISNDSETIETSLKKLSAHLVSRDVENVPEILQRLQTELDKDMARKMLAAKHGAYRVLIDLIKGFKSDVEILRPAIKTMTSLMTGYPDLLDETGIALQIELMKR